MRKTYKTILSVLAIVVSLIIPSSKAQANIERDQKQLINDVKKDTPLVLYHAKDAFKEQSMQLAWHYSHSSHYSHNSHNSHNSHYSHYSSRY